MCIGCFRMGATRATTSRAWAAFANFTRYDQPSICSARLGQDECVCDCFSTASSPLPLTPLRKVKRGAGQGAKFERGTASLLYSLHKGQSPEPPLIAPLPSPCPL